MTPTATAETSASTTIAAAIGTAITLRTAVAAAIGTLGRIVLGGVVARRKILWSGGVRIGLTLVQLLVSFGGDDLRLGGFVAGHWAFVGFLRTGMGFVRSFVGLLFAGGFGRSFG